MIGNVNVLLFARALSGLCAGISSALATVIVTEVLPKNLSGVAGVLMF